MARRRWDEDAHGVGVADARGWTPIVETLASLATADGWVAEEPEAHLLPHLAAAASGMPVAIRATRTDPDGTFAVDLEWLGDAAPSRAEIRAAVFGLVAAVAETVTVVREPPETRGRVVEILTGSADSEAFAGHGHTLRFSVTIPATG